MCDLLDSLDRQALQARSVCETNLTQRAYASMASALRRQAAAGLNEKRSWLLDRAMTVVDARLTLLREVNKTYNSLVKEQQQQQSIQQPSTHSDDIFSFASMRSSSSLSSPSTIHFDSLKSLFGLLETADALCVVTFAPLSVGQAQGDSAAAEEVLLFERIFYALDDDDDGSSSSGSSGNDEDEDVTIMSSSSVRVSHHHHHHDDDDDQRRRGETALQTLSEEDYVSKIVLCPTLLTLDFLRDAVAPTPIKATTSTGEGSVFGSLSSKKAQLQQFLADGVERLTLRLAMDAIRMDAKVALTNTTAAVGGGVGSSGSSSGNQLQPKSSGGCPPVKLLASPESLPTGTLLVLGELFSVCIGKYGLEHSLVELQGITSSMRGVPKKVLHYLLRCVIAPQLSEEAAALSDDDERKRMDIMLRLCDACCDAWGLPKLQRSSTGKPRRTHTV